LYPGKELNLNMLKGYGTPSKIEKEPDEFDAV
jgi:hypothetical protein